MLKSQFLKCNKVLFLFYQKRNKPVNITTERPSREQKGTCEDLGTVRAGATSEVGGLSSSCKADARERSSAPSAP